MRLFLTLCISLFSICFVQAQTIIVSGTVHDENEKIVSGAIIKLMDGTRTLNFCSSSENGTYKLQAESKSVKLRLVAQLLGYAKAELSIDAKTQQADITLTSHSIQLREVTVKAPPVQVKNDTVKFNLKSFTSKGDITLEDGLKKLPGISVANDGEVSYMGKKISQMFIEGADMLGGKYNIATNNIKAKDATTIEVLRHHHRNKIDKSAFSDEVALNVKLSAKAKKKLFLSYEIGAGYQTDKALYKVGITGMKFNKKEQLITSAKIDNVDGGMGMYEMIDHFRMSGGNSLAQTAIGDFGNSLPPVNDKRYKQGTNASLTFYRYRKFKNNRSLNTQVDYSFRHNSYDYNSTKQYFTQGDSSITISEAMLPIDERHIPNVVMNYHNDGDSLLVDNKFSLHGEILHASSNGTNNASPISQYRKVQSFDIINGLNLQRICRKNRWGLNANVQYNFTPVGRVDFTLPNESPFLQQAHSNSLITNVGTTFDSDLSTYLKLHLPLAVNYTYNKLRTEFSRSSDKTVNDVRGSQAIPQFAPQLELRSPSQRYNISLSAKLYYLYLEYADKDRNHTLHLSTPYLDPRLNIHYQATSESEINASASLSHSTGDILDLLIHPVQTDYRSQIVRSGILAKKHAFNSNLEYRLQLPMKFFFFMTNIAYGRNTTNLLTSQFVSSAHTDNTSLIHDNHSDNVSFTLSASKNILPINTKITMRGNYNWNRQQVMQQDVLLTYYGQIYSTHIDFKCNPVDWIELSYASNLSKSFTRYADTKNSITNHNHNAELSYYLSDKIRLFGKLEYRNNELAYNQRKSATFFDFGVQYRFKSSILKVELNNIFNVKHYAYTIYNGVNYFAYDYLLRGRNIMVTLSIR